MRSRMDEIEEEKESLKKSLAGAAEKKMDLNGAFFNSYILCCT